ncbi:MAG: MTH1187 family thiamine-binding protein, partial [Phycisphaerae bacterium]
DYRLGPMGTSLEADDWDRALGVVRQCFEQMRQDCRRIACSIHVDYRLGPTGRLAGKVESLERRLGRPLKK